MMAALAVMVIAGATIAYFSDGIVIRDNVFATGTVDLRNENTAGFPLIFNNLTPGKWQHTYVKYRYMGTINADIYMGNTGSDGGFSDEQVYLATTLKIKVTEVDPNNYDTVYGVKFNGYAVEFVQAWKKIATNVAPNELKAYKVEVRLDEDVNNTLQGKTNDHTVVLLLAIQNGAPAPTGMPLYADLDDPYAWY
jgi:hypothetical protein